MSLTTLYVSFDTILNRFYRDFKFLTISYQPEVDDMAEWVADRIAHAHVPDSLPNEFYKLDVQGARAKIPVEVLKIEQVAYYNENGTFNPMRYNVATFFNKIEKVYTSQFDYNCDSDITYQINNGCIYTSFQNGTIALAAKILPFDDNGYPLVPKEESWQLACVYKLALETAKYLFYTDKISGNKYQLIERDAEWYFAQAVNGSKVLSIDREESFTNQVTRTIPKTNNHANLFLGMGAREFRFNELSRKNQ